MGVIINPESALGQELQRWNQFPMHKSDGEIIPAGNPYVFRPYPKMLYRASLSKDSGKAECLQPQPDPTDFLTQPEYDRACQRVEQFNKRCTLIVHEDSQERRAAADGWHLSIQAAIEGYEQEQRRIADAAAERAYSDQRMSPKAQAEAARAEAATHEHVAEVKAPKKRPYRRKVQPKVAVTTE